MPTLAFNYFTWHYSRGLRDYMRTWTNFIWFFWHFFSVGILSKTLFAPFRRIRETNTQPGLHIDIFFQNLLVNLIMRVVGFVLRSILIIIGMLAIGSTLVVGSIFLFVWLFMPLVLVTLIGTGILFLLS